MRVWIGTSGFQYPEWKGTFYPEKISKPQMLPYYAERFPSTESNYSFRSIPSRKTIDAWAGATPPRFKFSFKAPQKITHFAKLRGCAETLRYFQTAISPMGEKLGAVLFQLPPTLRKDTALLAAFLDEVPSAMRAAFEFRHESWFEDDVLECLRQHRAALCVAESEALLTPAMATADFGYLRLRREDYSLKQIERWAEWVEQQRAGWSDTFIYFKHEEKAVGPKFARQMQAALGEAVS
jgi:uncharacterized protein YecE (DUF72 family)